MVQRLQKTLADYVVIAISPALIMTMVGSLVFFLLALFYVGDYQGRLHFILALFVFAAVLIARIAIEEGTERAGLFGIPLALVTGVAVIRFVSYRGGFFGDFRWVLNLSLVAVIWWCAHRLTWDCTLIDESDDSTDEGLLQTIGIAKSAAELSSPKDASPSDPSSLGNSAVEPEGVTTLDAKSSTAWERFVAQQRRPHAPGVWIVYFSLAALPLFGIGSLFIPHRELDTRQYVFRLFCVYMASGLGLLLTTSFLGLRRYLRQRRLEMPVTMANAWIGTGCVMILLLLIVAALLPRTGAEYSVSQIPLPEFGSPDDLSASRFAVGQEGVEDDSSAPRSQGGDESSQGGGETRSGDSGGQSDDSGSTSSEGDPSHQDSGRRQDGGKPQSASDEDRSSEGEGPQSEGSDGRSPGEQNDAGESSSNESPSESDSYSENARSDGDRDSSDHGPRQGASDESSETSGESSESPRPDQPPSSDSTPNDSQPSQRTPSPSNPTSPITNLSMGLTDILKWVLYGLLAAIVIFLCWRYRQELVAAWQQLLEELRAFWRRLFDRAENGDGEESRLSEAPSPSFRRFGDFVDPFASGASARFSADGLVRYSFEALEAWARDCGCGRRPEQTPHDLAHRVAAHQASLASDARELADLYSQLAYAPGSLRSLSAASLQRLWEEMRKHAPVVTQS